MLDFEKLISGPQGGKDQVEAYLLDFFSKKNRKDYQIDPDADEDQRKAIRIMFESKKDLPERAELALSHDPLCLEAFFVYYLIFVLLPVTGPQFYYLAVGTEKIAAGVFPDLGNWFLTHAERMEAPGWSDGFFHHLLSIAHDAGERPTAAFPSSHVGITTVLVMLALRTRSKGLIFTILPFYILMCFSTVYLYAHYAIDAVAGLLTGVALYYSLSHLYQRT